MSSFSFSSPHVSPNTLLNLPIDSSKTFGWHFAPMIDLVLFAYMISTRRIIPLSPAMTCLRQPMNQLLRSWRSGTKNIQKFTSSYLRNLTMKSHLQRTMYILPFAISDHLPFVQAAFSFHERSQEIDYHVGYCFIKFFSFWVLTTHSPSPLSFEYLFFGYSRFALIFLFLLTASSNAQPSHVKQHEYTANGVDDQVLLRSSSSRLLSRSASLSNSGGFNLYTVDESATHISRPFKKSLSDCTFRLGTEQNGVDVDRKAPPPRHLAEKNGRQTNVNVLGKREIKIDSDLRSSDDGLLNGLKSTLLDVPDSSLGPSSGDIILITPRLPVLVDDEDEDDVPSHPIRQPAISPLSGTGQRISKTLNGREPKNIFNHKSQKNLRSSSPFNRRGHQSSQKYSGSSSCAGKNGPTIEIRADQMTPLDTPPYTGSTSSDKRSSHEELMQSSHILNDEGQRKSIGAIVDSGTVNIASACSNVTMKEADGLLFGRASRILTVRLFSLSSCFLLSFVFHSLSLPSYQCRAKLIIPFLPRPPRKTPSIK